MEIKKLWRYFVIVFLIAFLVINWKEISWLFNYQMVFGLISDFFQKETEEQILVKPNFEYSEKENSLEIPKIGVIAPLIFDKNLNDKGVYKALEGGVVYYPDSALPGETGQTIILGHSAPPQWPKVKYYHIFVRLNELDEGDEIYLYFNNKKYQYIVSKKYFLEKGEEIPQGDLTRNSNMLYLISCWPPETGKKRIAVEAELKI